LRNRFTFNEGQSPVWAPDGSRIAFVSDREGTVGVYLKEVGGTGEAELLYANDKRKFPVAWTPDGKMVLYIEFTAGAKRSLFGLPVEGGREPIPLIESEFAVADATVAPDGRWLAYTSTESGRREVYVTTFPQLERKWQVSSEGGRQPVWTKDGSEIVFASLPINELYAAEVSTGGDTFTVGSVQKVLDVDLRADPGRDWDVTADGKRILTNAMPERGRVSALHLVVNWPAILEDE
jgi:Tol biopolymer transport system component